jgi:hypothetical protein
VLFGFQLARKRRSANALLLGIACGCLGAIIAVLLAADRPFQFYQIPSHVLLSLQVALYTAQFYFWYIHLDRIMSIRINPVRYGLVLCLTLISWISLFFIVMLHHIPDVTARLWMLADIGYDGLAIGVFLLFGVYVNLRTYKYTHEKRPVLCGIASLFIGLGFIIIFISDYLDFAYFAVSKYDEVGESGLNFLELAFMDNFNWIIRISEQNSGYAVLDTIGHVLPLIGLLLFIIVYLTDIDYIYRMPFDTYSIIVAYRDSGNLIHASFLKTSKPLPIETHLVSGMLVAMNSLFGEIFRGKHVIQQITGANAALLFEGGEKILGIVVTERVSFYLGQSLRHYLKEFEQKFKSLINEKEANILKFQDARLLVEQCFPYCEIDPSRTEI